VLFFYFVSNTTRDIIMFAKNDRLSKIIYLLTALPSIKDKPFDILSTFLNFGGGLSLYNLSLSFMDVVKGD
jgi:hypothetical protein